MVGYVDGGRIFLKKQDLRQMFSGNGHAADALDAEVERIVRKLKQGKPVQLPGLGSFVPGPQPRFEFDNPRASSKEPRRAKR